MDRAECLVFLKGQERTENILSLSLDRKAGLYHVRFSDNDGKEYNYKQSDVQICKPEILSPDFCYATYKGKQFSGLTGIYKYAEAGYWYLERGEDHYLLKSENLSVSRSVLEDSRASDVLLYLKEVSFVNPIADEEGNRLLAKRYRQIDFVDEKSALARYLSGKNDESVSEKPSFIIYPFGCNKSQKKAVENALSNKLSVVQGPPGTGKTQTILTIIANLLVQNKTAELVSNNNSAVDNVREKLEGYGLSFLVASLGSSDNKKLFLTSQTGTYPDISDWKMTAEKIRDGISRIRKLSESLDKYYEIQESRQNKIAELSQIDAESAHFSSFSTGLDNSGRCTMPSQKLVFLLQRYSIYFQRYERLSIAKRIAAVFFRKVLTWKESSSSGQDILTGLQAEFYRIRRKELQDEIDLLDGRISGFDMGGKQKELSDMSLRILKAFLYNRFGEKTSRQVFTEDDLWYSPDSVLAEYPIITSTSFSSSSSLRSCIYDYVIIDEASQCDIATGALSLLSAKNAVIVGDIRQLQNVVTEMDRKYAESVFMKYDLPKPYKYSSESFLASVCALFTDIPSVMLREHYRCQPRIIGFCNEKFYGNELIIMTDDEKRKDEIELFLTASGHHSREHANLRQAEVIAKEVLPSLPEDTGSIGIITPYQNNVRLIRSVIGRDDIKVDTIHSFQGREMDTIIFSTSDDIITEFSDSPMLINVAVSRAKHRFILVVSSDPQPSASNIHDLISYISYSSFKSMKSGIVSVFDMLYEQSTKARMEFLANHRRISSYDSENLMFSAIEDIISSPAFSRYSFKVVCHYPVRYLFRDTSVLSEDERLYLSRTGTHVDFLIYRAIGKEPVVAIEVDGFQYHKEGSRQHERDLLKDSIFSKYGFPLLRFRTNGSGECGRIQEFLNQYIST